MPIAALLAALLLSTSAPTDEPDKAPCTVDRGIFSARAVRLWVAYGCDRSVTLRAPDRTTRARVDPQRWLTIAGPHGRFRTRIAEGPNGEMGWSRDGRGLFVTENDGGAGGAYLAFAVLRTPGGWVRRDLTALIIRAYRHPGRCYEREVPNVYALGWLDTRRLVVIGQTYPHSNCDAFGSFTAYVVDPLHRRILETVPQPQTRRRFGALMGAGFRASADDPCGRKPLPTACMIPDLHPELFDKGGKLRR